MLINYSNIANHGLSSHESAQILHTLNWNADPKLSIAERYIHDGRWSEAEELSLEILSSNPYNDKAIYILAIVAASKHIPDFASECLDHCIRIRPWFSPYYRDIIKIFISINDLNKASYYCKVLIDIETAGINHFLWGIILHLMDHHVEAVCHFHQAILLEESLADRVFSVYQICNQCREIAKPIHLNQTAEGKKFPSDQQLVHLLFDKGFELHSCEDLKGALVFYNAVLAVDQEYIDALYNKGLALISSGQEIKAIEYIQTAINMQPSNPIYYAGILLVWKNLRDSDKISSTLDALLDWNPLDQILCFFPIWSIIEASTAIKNNERISDVLNVIDRFLEDDQHSRITDEQMKMLMFSLGNLYHKYQFHDKAFRCYQHANGLKSVNYDHDLTTHFFKSIIDIYSSFTVTERSSKNPSDLPIFIIGLPRTGTSLVESIISSHPYVYAAHEIEYIYGISQIIENLSAQFYPYYCPIIDSDLLNHLSSVYIDRIRKLSPSALRVTDKNTQNFMYLGLINQLFPHSKVILCSRNPLDTGIACYFKDFYGDFPFAYDLNSFGKYYKCYDQLIRFWKQKLTLPIYEVSYEELVLNHEATVRSMIDFCGLEWSDACLLYYKNADEIHTASRHQVREPIYKHSLGQYKNYIDYLSPLIAELKGIDSYITSHSSGVWP